jgi:hypothetical protein
LGVGIDYGSAAYAQVGGERSGGRQWVISSKPSMDDGRTDRRLQSGPEADIGVQVNQEVETGSTGPVN